MDGLSLEEQLQRLREIKKICDEIKGKYGKWDDKARDEAQKKVDEIERNQRIEHVSDAAFWFDLITGQNWAIREYVYSILKGAPKKVPPTLAGKVAQTVKDGGEAIGINADAIGKLGAVFAIGTIIFFAVIELVVHVTYGGDLQVGLINFGINILFGILQVAGAATITSLIVSLLPFLSAATVVISYIASLGLSKILDYLKPHMSQLVSIIISNIL